MLYSKLRNNTYSIKTSGGDSRKMHHFAIDINQAHTFGREMKPREALKQKREFLSPLGWSGLTFGAAKQCRTAGTNIEQARTLVRGRWRTH